MAFLDSVDVWYLFLSVAAIFLFYALEFVKVDGRIPLIWAIGKGIRVLVFCRNLNLCWVPRSSAFDSSCEWIGC